MTGDSLLYGSHYYTLNRYKLIQLGVLLHDTLHNSLHVLFFLFDLLLSAHTTAVCAANGLLPMF